jgi:hypothetical protein
MSRAIPAAALVLGLLAAVGYAAEAAKPDQEPANGAYMKCLKEIRLVEIRHLRSNNAAEFEKGRQKILAIKDDESIGPMVSVLYGTNARYRGLLIEALTAMAAANSQVAQAYLQEIAVGDGSSPHRRRAVDALKQGTGDPATGRLMAHLALDEVPVIRDRAASALATLNEKRAVWLLVERLVTEDVRMVGGEVWSGSMQLDIRTQMAGVPTFRHSVIQAAVPNGGIATATIDLPEVKIVDIATTIAMADPGHAIPKYERIRTEHPDILAALRALTGKDFGFNQPAWQQWLQSEEAAKKIPAWEPLILKTG